MDIRFIYMPSQGAQLSDSQWMFGFDDDFVESRALSHAAHDMRCSLLVVERDPSTGHMAPLGFAAIL